MLQHITKALLLFSIMLITTISEAATDEGLQDNIIKSEYSATVPICSNGSLSEMKWRKGSTSLNENAFLFDEKRGDTYWHGMINNTAKGTWSNFNNRDARTVIRKLLGDEASQLNDLSVVQVEYDKEVSPDGKSAKLTFKTAMVLKSETVAIELLKGP